MSREPSPQITTVADVGGVPPRAPGVASLGRRALPLLVLLLYLNGTVLLFAYGPWPYQVPNAARLHGYLAMVHLALMAGYVAAMRRRAVAGTCPLSPARLLQLCVVVNLVLLLPTSWFRTGHLIPDVRAGLLDPGGGYAASLESRISNPPLVEFLRLPFGPLLAGLLPLAAFYWSRVGRGLRWLALATITGVVATFVAMGTNREIARVALLTPWLLVVSSLAAVQRWRRWQAMTTGGLLALAFLAFLAFFTATQGTRSGSAAAGGYFPATGEWANAEHPLVRHLRPDVRVGFYGLTSYLTQGYYALALALDEPFIPMYGVGGSMFLTRQAVRLTGNHELAMNSYPARIERHGWDAQRLWSSIYPWLASDLSFPGTIAAVFAIGYLLGLAWLDAMLGRNPLAVCALAQLLLMVLYFPANNQCLQDGEGVTAFWGTLMAWLATRYRVSARGRTA